MAFYVSAGVPADTYTPPSETSENILKNLHKKMKNFQDDEKKFLRELEDKDEMISKLEEKIVRAKFSSSKKNHKENVLEISLSEVGKKNKELTTMNSKLSLKLELLQVNYDKVNTRYQKLVSISEEDSETVSNDSETVSNDSETVSNDSETVSNDSETVSNDSETVKTSKKDNKKGSKKK